MFKSIRFRKSSIYNLGDNDQHDVNKLFGFSFWWHQTNSVRFGWRPNSDLTKMEVVAYEYLNGERIPTMHVVDVNVDEYYKYLLEYDNKNNIITYKVMTSDGVVVGLEKHPYKPKSILLGYRLYLYFGGNRRAPKDITIDFVNMD